MNLVFVFGVALALAMDCFAVSLGISVAARGLALNKALRLGVFFGCFQFGMAVGGWFAGENVVRFIRDFDHWIAFGLLAFIGGKMIYESFEKSDEEKGARADETSGLRLLLLSIATSIDSLSVGFSLGVLGTAIFLPSVVIGAVSFLMTLIGARLGPIADRVVGKRAELLGGLILIAIGIRVLVEHLRG